LYEIDVHYYLTYYLAKQTGCFSDAQARAIANGNQVTDEDDQYAPGPGRIYRNSRYHALHPGASPGKAFYGGGLDFFAFGRFLHYYQDTFSHAGFDNSAYGHTKGGHGVDKTATAVGKAMRMARGTYNEISKFAERECKCKPPGWNSSMEETVRKFSEVKTKYPNLADIEGNVALGYSDFAYADYAALGRKVGILGVPFR